MLGANGEHYLICIPDYAIRYFHTSAKRVSRRRSKEEIYPSRAEDRTQNLLGDYSHGGVNEKS